MLHESHVLSDHGRFARAFALACTALEEIGKSQFAADIYTGYLPHETFEKLILNHSFKYAYASRDTYSFQPWVDEEIARQLFQRRNDALYASPTNEVRDADFELDATTMIRYCYAWLERIARTEEDAERIGTKGFLK